MIEAPIRLIKSPKLLMMQLWKAISTSNLMIYVLPDGVITNITPVDEISSEAIVFIEKISPAFVGFKIPKELVFFNIKSTLAQVGLDGVGFEYDINEKNHCAQVKVLLKAHGNLAKELLKLINVGMFIGKLFAADERRRVRDPDYLFRMFGRSDRKGKPLLSLGGLQGSNDLILDKIDGRTVAYLTLQNGRGFPTTTPSTDSFLHSQKPSKAASTPATSSACTKNGNPFYRGISTRMKSCL